MLTLFLRLFNLVVCIDLLMSDVLCGYDLSKFLRGNNRYIIVPLVYLHAGILLV